MGQKYDVMGQSYEVYNILTTSTLQVNSRFIPYYKSVGQIVPTGTMMGEIGRCCLSIMGNKNKALNLEDTISTLMLIPVLDS